MKKRNKSLAALMIVATLILFIQPFTITAEEAPSISPSSMSYPLTDTIQAEVKSILNERIASGTRIAAVVRLYNQGSRAVRVPEYEVGIKAEGDIVYTLHPSADNPKTIEPKEKVEFSYMIQIDRKDIFSLSEIFWTEIDEFEYPRKEKTVLTLPISSLEWQGDASVFSNLDSTKPWGESISIPVLSPSLEFTTVDLFRQNTPQGPATVVVLLAENKGSMKESIPDFRIDGKTDQKVYPGKRIEQETITLEPGGKQYIHYAIQTGNNVQLNRLILLTPESFVTANQTRIDYTVGRLNIRLPAEINDSHFLEQSAPYEQSKAIQFDPLNQIVSPAIDVSMVELHMHEGEGEGYKTVIAKFKLHSRSDIPIPVPNFQTALVSTDGFTYLGTRQSTVAQTLVPNLSYVISYSFNMPNSEKGEKLAMKIMDGQSADPFQIPIAEFQTRVQNDRDESNLKFYPFQVKLNNWSVTTQAIFSGDLSYSYKLRLDLEIQRQDNVVVDQNFSKMKLELVDVLGRTLGSETVSFTGAKRLATGWQTIEFNNVRAEQIDNQFSINMYESIDTPFGEAKRLVKTLRVK